MEVTYRVPTAIAAILLTLAVIGDIVQIALKLLDLTGIGIILGEGIGWLMSLLIISISGIMYTSSGVNFLFGTGMMRKLIRFVVTFLIEFFPLLNLLPTLTIWTWLTIRESRAEDRKLAERNATMKEPRHVEVRKKRLRERVARRMMRTVPVLRTAESAYGAMERRAAANDNMRRPEKAAPTLQRTSAANDNEHRRPYITKKAA